MSTPRRSSRVLHVYAGNLYGGIETILVTLARHACEEAGVTHEFALCFQGRLQEELLAAGAIVHDLAAVRLRRPWSVVSARRRLRGLLRQRRFDAAMTHGCWPHALFAPVIRETPLRLVTGVHDRLTGRHWTERLARRTPPDALIANSRYSAGQARSVFPTIPASVVHPPLGVEPWADAPAIRQRIRAEMNTPAECVVILQASRLERMKGQALHLAALSRIRAVPGWVAWFAGGVQRPAERRFLQELPVLAERWGLTDRVRFLGERRDVPELMAAADVYCQPTVGPEAFGLAYIEALSRGLPVIASDLGGAAEIVTEGCGILTKPCDSEGVAEALRSLVGDGPRRRTMGQEAVARAWELCEPGRQLRRFQAEMLGPSA